MLIDEVFLLRRAEPYKYDLRACVRQPRQNCIQRFWMLLEVEWRAICSHDIQPGIVFG